MRILCVVDCYLPSTKSSAKLMHDLAAEFVARGHEVVVATPDDQLSEACTLTEADGVTALRIRTGKIKGANLLTRAVNEARLSAVMWKRGRAFFRSHAFDRIVFYSPSIFFGRLIGKLKLLYQCPAYLILRDIFPQWAVDAGVMRKGLAWRYFRHVERLQYRVADVIGVQSPANLEYFASQPNIAPGEMEVLYNWTPETCPKPSLGLRERLGLKDKVVFFYGGNIGIAQDMDNLLRLAGHLCSDPRAHFLFLGDGSEVPRLQREIHARGLNNVTIHPPLSQDQYQAVVGEFDVGLISLARDLSTHNVPGKMLGYMLHGLPILASINPGNDLRDLIESAEAGLVSINGDDETLWKNARELLACDTRRDTLGRNAKALLRSTFSVHTAADQILSH